MQTVMTIAGLDPSGGAGLLADIKTIGALSCYGVGVLTSVTYQSTLGVFGSHDLSRDEVRSQMMPLLADFDVAAIKTGMLPTADIVEEVVACLKESFFESSIPNLVVDPVCRSSSGYQLISDSALDSIRRLLLPIAAVVAPNRREAAMMTGLAVTDESSAEDAAREILRMGPRAVVVTGGDSASELVTDVLVDATRTIVYRGERLDSSSTHGTGCTFASAIACLLAAGMSVDVAVREAKEYVEKAIRDANPLGRGIGPLDHFHSHRIE